MRVISPQLEAHFAGGMTTLATCWRLTRQDTTELGFTDHDRALVIDSLEYDSIAGFTPTTVESKSNMSVDNFDLEGQTFPSKITESDLLAGLYDYAEIETFLVNYAHLTQGKLVVKRGRLGEITLNSQMFQAEVRGLTQHLSQTIGQVFSPSCRAILGDSKCKVALASFTVAATVTEVVNNQTFKASALAQAAGWFMHRLAAIRSNKQFLIKAAIGGNDLYSDWNPDAAEGVQDGLNRLKSFLTPAISALEQWGFVPSYRACIIGLGENDASSATKAAAYAAIQARLNEVLRELTSASLPIMLVACSTEAPADTSGRSDGNMAQQATIRTAQVQVATAEALTQLYQPITTGTLAWNEATPNGIHFNMPSLQQMGIELADLIHAANP